MKLDDRIVQCFDHTDYAFHPIQFKKDEMIFSPLEPNNKIIFILSGIVAIYAIQEDGNRRAVGLSDGFIVLGDVEFVDELNPTYYVEARSLVKGVYIDRIVEKEKLHRDITFLHFVMSSLLHKVKLTSTETFTPFTTEEKILDYMKDHVRIQNIEKTAFQLRCSKRQFIRALKKMCEEGILTHPKKGIYEKKKD